MAPDDDATFPNTRWTLVGRLGHADFATRRAALTELLTRYMPALRAYLVRAHRLPPDRADDILQSFLLSKVLEEELLQRADPRRGRFRSFLMISLDHFLISQHRHDSAHKRSAGPAQSLDHAPEPAGPEPRPDEIFDLQWAREILSEAVCKMHAECHALRRPDIWGVFQHRVLPDLDPNLERLDYAALVQRFALASPVQAANVLVTGKRMFSRALRHLVLEYEPDAASADQEIIDLRTILAKARES